MPRKRRSFIDKSRATTYRVICRETDDGEDEDEDEGVPGEDEGAPGEDEGVPGEDAGPRGGGEDDGGDDDEDDEEAFYRAWRKRRDEAAAAARGPGGGERPAASTLPHERRMEILALGFPDDGYDYLQHLKTIGGGADGDASAGGGNVFIASSRPRAREVAHDERAYDGSLIHEILGGGGGAAAERPADARASSSSMSSSAAADGGGGGGGDIGAAASKVQALRSVPRNRDVLEVMEEMDRVAAVEEMEPGVFGCGDLNDDFVLRASQPAEDREGGGEGAPHAPARRAAPGRGDGGAAARPSGAAYMKEVDVRLRLVDECFDALALREYNEDYGDGASDSDPDEDEDEDEDGGGGADISEFDDVLEEYLAEERGAKYLTENDEDARGPPAPAPAPTAAPAAAAAAAAAADERDYGPGAVERRPYREERRPSLLGAAEDGGGEGGDEAPPPPPPDGRQSDGDGGGGARGGGFGYLGRESEWVEVSDYKSLNEDIESVASFRTTASTPSVIPMVRSLGVPKKKQADLGDAAKRIVLSKKTGVPIGYFPAPPAAAAAAGNDDDDGDGADGDGGAPRASTHRPRGRQESSDDRRARKQAVKQERRQNRARKKNLRTQFKSSEMRLKGLQDNPPTIPL